VAFVTNSGSQSSQRVHEGHKEFKTRQKLGNKLIEANLTESLFYWVVKDSYKSGVGSSGADSKVLIIIM